jgi:hypothetical protein
MIEFDERIISTVNVVIFIPAICSDFNKMNTEVCYVLIFGFDCI